MFKEPTMPGKENNRPEFVPLPGLEEKLLQKKQAERKKMIEESGFSEEEYNELERVCQDAFGNQFKYQEIEGTHVYHPELDIKKIEKISDTEAKVVGAGFSPKIGSGGGNWEIKVVKDENGKWRVEKAIEVEKKERERLLLIREVPEALRKELEPYLKDGAEIKECKIESVNILDKLGTLHEGEVVIADKEGKVKIYSVTEDQYGWHAHEKTEIRFKK